MEESLQNAKIHNRTTQYWQLAMGVMTARIIGLLKIHGALIGARKDTFVWQGLMKGLGNVDLLNIRHILNSEH